MAYIPRSSFIPKEASGGAIPMRVKRKRTIHVFSLLTTLLLVLSLVSAVGVYLYKDLLEKRLESAKAELNAVSEADNEAKMEEIRIYDNKLNIAQTLLDNHLSPSVLFEEIEGSTKVTVQFQGLDYSYDPGFEAILTLNGSTEEFTSLALQKMQFLKDRMFSEFVVRDISTQQETADESGKPVVSRQEEGDVTFTVTGRFEKDLLEYRGGAPVVETVETAVENATTSNEVTPQL